MKQSQSIKRLLVCKQAGAERKIRNVIHRHLYLWKLPTKSELRLRTLSARV